MITGYGTSLMAPGYNTSPGLQTIAQAHGSQLQYKPMAGGYGTSPQLLITILACGCRLWHKPAAAGYIAVVGLQALGQAHGS